METQFFVMAGNLPVAHVPSQDVAHALFAALETEFRAERLQGLSFSGLSQADKTRCAELLSELRDVQQGKQGEQLRKVSRAARRMMRDIAAMAPPAASPAPEPPAATEPAPELSKEGKALAVLSVHPEWSDTKIAKVAGCNRTTLYKFKTFVAAREILREGKSDLPRGSKFPDEGMEAWENEGDR